MDGILLKVMGENLEAEVNHEMTSVAYADTEPTVASCDQYRRLPIHSSHHQVRG